MQIYLVIKLRFIQVIPNVFHQKQTQEMLTLSKAYKAYSLFIHMSTALILPAHYSHLLLSLYTTTQVI